MVLMILEPKHSQKINHYTGLSKWLSTFIFSSSTEFDGLDDFKLLN